MKTIHEKSLFDWSVFVLVRCDAAWLQQLFHHVEFDPANTLILGQCKECQTIGVADARRVSIAVLIDQPLKLGGVRMARANVFALQVLKLRVNVVPVAHDESSYK